MGKPPRTPPHSDIDGVDEDARPTVATAKDAGENSSDVAQAKHHSKARPDYDTAPRGEDDRSG